MNALGTAVIGIALVAGASCSRTDSTSEPAATASDGEFCDELQRSYDATQEVVEKWEPDDLSHAAARQPVPVQRAAAEFAATVEQMQALHRSEPTAAPDAPTDELWQASQRMDILGWRQADLCNSTTIGGPIHDPAKNPSRLTQVAPTWTSDGNPVVDPPLAPYQIGIGVDGSVTPGQDPDTVDFSTQRPIVVYGDVDRQCFALGSFVSTGVRADESGVEVGPTYEERLVVATADAATRKSCGTETNGSDVVWTQRYDGWEVRIVASQDRPTSTNPADQVLQITEDRWLVATPPT